MLGSAVHFILENQLAITYIDHSNPKIAINFKSLYLEEFSFYWFETLQEHLHYAELDFCKYVAFRGVDNKNFNL